MIIQRAPSGQSSKKIYKQINKSVISNTVGWINILTNISNIVFVKYNNILYKF